MSEPLKDIQSKINGDTWALIEAESRVTGQEQAEIIRKVLHGWASQKWALIRVAQQLARAAGNPGE